MAVLKGSRYVMFISAIVGSIGLAIYPIIIRPMMNPDEYKQVRKAHPFEGRKH